MAVRKVDPFASNTETEAIPAPEVAVPSEGFVDAEGYTITIKGGGGFDAPWIVIRASSEDDARQKLRGAYSLAEDAWTVATHFASKAPAASVAAAPVRAASPTSAPAGAPEAPGPGWVWKSGVSKASGKPWKGWFPPQGSDEKPVFAR